MGGEMANIKNSDLKVPPLKIVLSSANSGGSDRSSSTSPSSESESLDSNLTIISDNQHDRSNTSKSDQKEETVQSKQDRAPRHSSKGSVSERNSSNNTALSNKRSYDNNGSIEDKVSSGDAVTGRELTSSSTQRITRSSQRAAQQNKSENLGETTSDETIAPETQDKSIESARKVKRRKGELPQDTEQDSNQQVPAPPPVMSNICPADYELPLQNSFELYRDIRKRPYKKLFKLTNIQPKMPHGFRDYFLNSGPYLLDGNRIGVGIKGGPSIDCKEALDAKANRLPNRVPPKLKYTSNQHKLPTCSSQQLRHDYQAPKLLEAPRNLKYGSPLYELFQDQERSRHKMRLQHLTERERSILTSEQEILRAYNKAAIVDLKQDLNLSACTYFYLQERYHYLDEKNDSIDCVNPKDLISSQINSGENQTIDPESDQLPSNDTVTHNGETSKSLSNLAAEDKESTERNERRKVENESETQADGPQDETSQKRRKRVSDCQNDGDLAAKIDGPSDKHRINGTTSDNSANPSQCDQDQSVKKEEQVLETRAAAVGEVVTVKTPVCEGAPVELSAADQLAINKSVFIDNLQEIDEKWAKIKKDMLIRHKNEADSLFAVQSLDWEWKAKEIGACDVRVALKIEPEFVPRVEVSALDY